MRKRKGIARLEIGLDDVLVNIRLLLVRYQHHDDVALRSSFRRGEDLKSVSRRLLRVAGARAQADNNVHAGILEVHRVRVALRAETDDGNRFAVEQGQVAVGIIVHLNHFLFPPKK